MFNSQKRLKTEKNKSLYIYMIDAYMKEQDSMQKDCIGLSQMGHQS